VTIRILSHYRVTDPDVACAALLHDAVEDHAAGLAPGGTRQAALAVLADRFGGRTAALVAAVTNPRWEPGRDQHEQYREHVTASLTAGPWARVIKASDFTDNAVGIIHLTAPKLAKLARKYAPRVPALRELILRPDTPLEADVKDMIAGQFDTAQNRFAAIRHSQPRANGTNQLRADRGLLLAANRAPAMPESERAHAPDWPPRGRPHKRPAWPPRRWRRCRGSATQDGTPRGPV